MRGTVGAGGVRGGVREGERGTVGGGGVRGGVREGR